MFVLVFLNVLIFFVYSQSVAAYPKVENLHVDVNIQTRFAVTQVQSTVYNLQNSNVEASSVFFLPYHCFISNFTAKVGETLYVGFVQSKTEAQSTYDEAVENDQSAALIGEAPWVKAPDGFTAFRATMNVAPQERVEWTLEYQEVLVRYITRYELLIPSIANEEVAHFSLKATIRDDDAIQFFDFYNNGLQMAVERSNIGSSSQDFTFSMQSMTPAEHSFSIRFDVANPNESGMLYVDPSLKHFVHFFSPPGLDVLSKEIVFVVDCSGSMEGEKIHQAKEALSSVLPNLFPTDRFEILCFDKEVAEWSSEMRFATSENLEAALTWIDESVVPKDTTNIEHVFQESFAVLKSAEHSMMPAIIFLSDGEPTEGEMDTQEIRRMIKSENANGLISIHCLGFGEGADMNFLNAVAYENRGIAVKVYSYSEAEGDIANFFDSASQPLLLNVGFQYRLQESTIENGRYASTLETLFTGMEIVTAGELPESASESELEVDITGLGASGVFTQSEELIFNEKSYISRMWAHLWIQHLTKQILISDIDESVDAKLLREEATRIAIEYQLVTPYTSYVLVVDGDASKETPHRQQLGPDYDTSHESRNKSTSVMIFWISILVLFSIL